MVNNTGNSYRTRQAVIACIALIAVAALILMIGVFDVKALAAVGIFIAILGADVAVMSLTFSSTPGKFGPSERDFRLFVGLFMMIVGITMALIGFDVNIYISIAVLIIGIAAIGLCATLLGNKSTKY